MEEREQLCVIEGVCECEGVCVCVCKCSRSDDSSLVSAHFFLIEMSTFFSPHLILLF